MKSGYFLGAFSVFFLVFNLVFPISVQAMSYVPGALIRDAQGAVYILSDGQRRPFTSSGAFLSYAYNTWNQVRPASIEDSYLSVGSFVPPQEGSIMCSDRGDDKGTCYLISMGRKAGFASETIFKSLGFSFHKDVFYGDVSWLPTAPVINTADATHLSGVLVNRNGAVYVVVHDGLVGIPNTDVFNSWGFRFTNVVPANGQDYHVPVIGTLRSRSSGALVIDNFINFNNNSSSTSNSNTSTSTTTGSTTTTSNPSSVPFYASPNLQSAQWARNNQSNRPSDAAVISRIAAVPQGIWFGNWNGDQPESAVKAVVGDAAGKNQTPIMVVYNIPARDCGGYSSGGSNSSDAYKSWVRSFAKGIDNRSAYVILEPDAIPGADCLSENNRQVRYDLLKDAVSVLKAGSGTKVYIDAGHCNWKSVDETADRLNRSGIGQADGFALNVSNFQTNECLIDFGTKVSAKVGNKHFVLDTSRNGVGPNQGNEWCNPAGRALGTTSTTNTGNSLVDAYLWIKTVGESDGNCNGGPSAGQFWPEYAVGLAQKAGF